jgi:hypothetical protein
VHIRATEGTRGLFKGSLARVLWVSPQSALTFSAYEFLKRHLGLDDEHHDRE